MVGGMCGRCVCVAGWHAWWGACVTGDTATEVGGAHPTEMLSQEKTMIFTDQAEVSALPAGCSYMNCGLR